MTIFFLFLLYIDPSKTDGSLYLLRQRDSVRFTGLMSEIGLKHPSVTAVAQDARGYIWLGSQYGLSRFDGDQVTTYYHDPHDSSSIPENWIQGMVVDKEGKLWIGTRNGLCFYDAPTDSFKQIRLPDVNISPIITGLVTDPNGHIWVNVEMVGLFQLDMQGNRLHYYDTRFEDEPEKYLFGDLLWHESGHLLIGGYQALCMLDPVSKEIEMIGDSCSLQMAKDNYGRVWFGGIGSFGVVTLDAAGKFQQQNIAFPGVEDLYLTDVLVDRSQFVWLSTEKGLYKWLPPKPGQTPSFEDETLEHFVNEPNNQHSLPSDYILCLFEDRSGMIWAGSYGTGIIYWSPGYPGISHFDLKRNDVQKIAWTGCYLEANDGKLWIGTRGHGLHVADLNRRQSHMIDIESKHKMGWILSMLELEKGVVLVASEGLHLAYADGSSEPIPLKSQEKEGLTPREMVWFNDRIWMASSKGLYSVDENFEEFRLELKADIQDILVDREHILWAGSVTEGLYRFKDNTWSQMITQKGVKNSFPANHIRTMNADNSGNIWVGTDRGIIRIEKDKEHFTYWGPDLLPERIISGIESDEMGMVWISGPSGIYRLDPENMHVQNFPAVDGFPSEYLLGSHKRLRDGRLLFGGFDGFAIFDPTRFLVDHTPPGLDIGGITVRNPKSAEARSVIKLAFGDENPLILQPGETWLDMELRALHYKEPDRNAFEYRMIGVADHWVMADSSRRKISFNGLKPGHYTFEFRAANPDGVWAEPLRMPIIVKPTFLQSPAADWSLAGGILLAIGLLIFAQRWKHSQAMESKNRDLQIQTLEGKLNESRLATLRAHLQPHFLFNTLNAISSLIRRNQVELADTLVADFAELFRLVLNRKDLKFVSLKEEMEFTQKYLLVERVRFQDRMTTEIHWDSRYDDFRIPPLIIQPLVENAVKHGISRVPGPVYVKVQVHAESIDAQSAQLVIRVEDNGPGFAQKISYGVGLQNIRERLSLHYGPDAVLETQNLEEQGASVCMRIPLPADLVVNSALEPVSA